jgi:DUF1680 family protein
MKGLGKVIRLLFVFALAVVGLGAQENRDYALRPVPFTRVTVADEFWQPRLETNRTVTIPFIQQKNEETGRALSLVLPDEMPLKAAYRADLLKGIVVVKRRALAANRSGGTAAGKTEQEFLAIPYYAWANRGAGEMAVWLARK